MKLMRKVRKKWQVIGLMLKKKVLKILAIRKELLVNAFENSYEKRKKMIEDEK